MQGLPRIMVHGTSSGELPTPAAAAAAAWALLMGVATQAVTAGAARAGPTAAAPLREAKGGDGMALGCGADAVLRLRESAQGVSVRKVGTEI